MILLILQNLYISVKIEYIISKLVDLPERIKQGLFKHINVLENEAQKLMKTVFN